MRVAREDVIPLYCPHVQAIEPHVVLTTPTDCIAWCQTCFRVRIIPLQQQRTPAKEA